MSLFYRTILLSILGFGFVIPLPFAHDQNTVQNRELKQKQDKDKVKESDLKIVSQYIEIRKDTNDVRFYGRANVSTDDFFVEADEIIHKRGDDSDAGVLHCRGNCIVKPAYAQYWIISEELDISLSGDSITAYNAKVIFPKDMTSSHRKRKEEEINKQKLAKKLPDNNKQEQQDGLNDNDGEKKEIKKSGVSSQVQEDSATEDDPYKVAPAKEVLDDTDTVVTIPDQKITFTGGYRYIVAKVVIKEGDSLRFKDAYLTDCDFADPGYEVLSDEVITKLEDNEFLLDKYPLQLFNTTVWLFDVPIFYWPYLEVSKGRNEVLDSIVVGRTTRFGNLLYLTWLLEIYEDENLDIDLKVETDYRQFRGYALGIDPEWDYNDSYGYIDSYFMDDKGPNLNNDFDKKFAELDVKDRYRLRSFNRIFIDNFTFDLEYSKFSDRFLQEDIFEREFKTGKEQETTFYAKYHSESYIASLQFKGRINRFQNQLEKIPEANYYHSHYDLFDFATYNGTTTVSNLRGRFDDDLNQPSERTWRVLHNDEIRHSTSLSVLGISAFINNTWTYYEEDINQESQYRDLLSAGGDIYTSMSRDYNSFVHRIDMTAGTVNQFYEKGKGDFLFQLTEQERLTKYWETSFALEQFIFVRRKITRPEDDPTKRERYYRFDRLFDEREMELETVELNDKFVSNHIYVSDGDNIAYVQVARLKLELEYYPKFRRDTVTFNETNFVYPFNWMGIFPLPGESLEERKFSNFIYKFDFSPWYYLSLNLQGEYNTRELREDIRSVGLRVSPSQYFSIFISEHKEAKVTDQGSLGFSLILGRKWKVNASTTRDFEQDRLVNVNYSFERDLHDFVLGFVAQRNIARDENLYFISLLPKFVGRSISSTQFTQYRETTQQ